MSEIPQDLLYTEDHEYLKPAGDAGRRAIGITDYAQGELGDIVFVELPKVGATLQEARRLRHDRGGEGGVGAVLAGARRGASRSTPASTTSRRW